MKKFKKIMAVLVAAIMVVAMTVPAWAATGRIEDGDTGTITVSGGLKGETYKLYKLFDLISFNDPDGHTGLNDHTDNNGLINEAYAYALKRYKGTTGTTANPWVAFFNDDNYGKPYFDIDFTNPITVGEQEYYIVKKYNFGSGVFNEEYNSITDQQTDFDADTTFYAQSSQKFAQLAKDYAEKVVSGAPQIPADATEGPLAADGNVTFADKALGYYMVTTTTGTLVSLDTNNRTVTMYEKNDKITVSNKEVQEDSGSTGTGEAGDGKTAYSDKNDADFGQVVNFKTYIQIEKGAENYVMHDTMDSAAFKWRDKKTSNVYDEIHVYIQKRGTGDTINDKAAGAIELQNGVATNLTTLGLKTYAADKADFFEVKTGTDITAGETFNIVFDQDFLNDIDTAMDDADDHFDFLVTYTADLKNGADVGPTGDNFNKSWVTYGEAQKTGESITQTYTYELDLYKYTERKGASTPEPLANAQFQIKLSAAGSSNMILIRVSEGDASNPAQYKYDYRVQSEVIPAKTDSMTADDISSKQVQDPESTSASEKVYIVDTIKTPASGKVIITGLDADEYTITETLAPEGYHMLAAPILVKILGQEDVKTGATYYGTAAGTILTYDSENTDWVSDNISDPDSTGPKGNIQLGIVNTTSKELPSTGGAGTTVLYIVGGMLVILAGAYLFFSRKRTA